MRDVVWWGVEQTARHARRGLPNHALLPLRGGRRRTRHARFPRVGRRKALLKGGCILPDLFRCGRLCALHFNHTPLHARLLRRHVYSSAAWLQHYLPVPVVAVLSAERCVVDIAWFILACI